ncbi:hypothetical protein J120_01065 [candidate division TM6 bacterium JCVI TM6SC1]|uniref:HdeD protein n=1 Tax=candidate division TM6 bacterium JCVI TM6SC1 TaxID=1306947 RepID=A0A0D2K5L5_9BACT|nr:hypothetical protein J120_01065 [candidate division TM6 bacterium JCVI TM6SC1]
MKTNTPTTYAYLADIPNDASKRKWVLFTGIISVVIGTAALAFSPYATLASMVILGAFLIVGSVVELANVFQLRSWQGSLVHLLAAVLYAISGMLAIFSPVSSALSLTLIIAAFFVVLGTYRIIAALKIRPEHWGWMILNGVTSVILGILLWYQWPLSGVWAIGMLIGIELMVSGWTLIMLSYLSKHHAHSTKKA